MDGSAINADLICAVCCAASPVLAAEAAASRVAVAAVPAQGFPIDVTFPGENEPDQVDAWISAYAEPFYIRA